MLNFVDPVTNSGKRKYDADTIDRLNCFWTTGFFCVLIGISIVQVYAGSPITCWLPSEFTGEWTRPIESSCFSEGFYYVSFQESKLPESNEGRQIRYYYWVPLALFFQLFLFLLPNYLWKKLSWKSNIYIPGIIGNTDRGKKPMKIYFCHKDHCDKNCEAWEDAHRFRGMIKPNRKMDLTTVYMGYKGLNLAVTLLQLFGMEKLLNTSYDWGWGMGALRDYWSGRTSEFSDHFPRVGYCDYERRDDLSGNVMESTIQCGLNINQFYEWVFVVVWFWLVALSVCNIGNLICWLILTYSSDIRIYFIKAQLNYSARKYNKMAVRSFVDNWLSIDGITALRLVSSNAGDSFSAEVITAMYEEYLKEFQKRQPNALPPLSTGVNTSENPRGLKYRLNAGNGKHPAPKTSRFSFQRTPTYTEDYLHTVNVPVGNDSLANSIHDPAPPAGALTDDDDYNLSTKVVLNR